MLWTRLVTYGLLLIAVGLITSGLSIDRVGRLWFWLLVAGVVVMLSLIVVITMLVAGAYAPQVRRALAPADYGSLVSFLLSLVLALLVLADGLRPFL